MKAADIAEEVIVNLILIAVLGVVAWLFHEHGEYEQRIRDHA